LVGERI